MLQTTVQKTKAVFILLVAALVLSACGGGASEGGDAAAQEDGGGNEVQDTSLQLFWFPEPEHGNIFGADHGGLYEENGLNVDILDGGPEIAAGQIVASGRADFGMGNADEIALAQSEGIPLVAIAANFQTSPQILMYHEGSGIEEPEDMSGRTVYTAPTANYWTYIKEEYGIEPAQEVAYSGSLAPFINDEEAVNQGYVTSEPYTLQQQGVEVDYFINADLGYNPYVVLFTTEQTIEQEPEKVRAFVEASMPGWDYYFDNVEEVNGVIGERNTELTMEEMTYSAENMEDLIYNDVTEENGMGYMTEERWQTLVDQLEGIGSLEEPVEVSDLYTNEFLPEN